MDLDFKRELLVREAMSSPVVTVDEGSSVVKVSEIMAENEIGAIIVISKEGKPVGIVTERDLVYRVIAKGSSPKEVMVEDVMSSPLQTVGPEESLEAAMSTMNKINVRRLGVVYKGNLEGVISDKDVIRIMPTIIEIVRERSKIQSGDISSGLSLMGYCSRCNMYSMNLRRGDGGFLCEDCRADSTI
jgi:CBS domain-containing protein